jgi:hypothetical protein
MGKRVKLVRTEAGYWEFEESPENGRTWYELRFNGSVLAQTYDGNQGLRTCGRPRDPFDEAPAGLLNEIPGQVLEAWVRRSK